MVNPLKIGGRSKFLVLWEGSSSLLECEELLSAILGGANPRMQKIIQQAARAIEVKEETSSACGLYTSATVCAAGPAGSGELGAQAAKGKGLVGLIVTKHQAGSDTPPPHTACMWQQPGCEQHSHNAPT